MDLLIPNAAWVVVAGRTRAIVYRNQGDEGRLDLRLEDVFDDRGRRQRSPAPAGPNFLHEIGRTAVPARADDPPPDLATALGAELARACDRGLFHALVVVAPPRLLGSLRAALPQRVADRLIGVVPKDLARLDVETVEAHLIPTS